MDGEVVIVGAGVAGCATALHLAALGREVVLVDRAAFPRQKVCGEGLMPHGVAELEGLGLIDAVREAGCHPFKGISYHVGDQSAQGDFPDGRTGLGVRRWRLDRVLADACEAHDRIDLRLGSKVERIGVSRSQVIVESTEGDIWAKVIVGADGLNSTVRRELGLHTKTAGRKRYGVRAHFQLDPDQRDRDYVDVYVGGDAEYYLTPVGPGETNLAVLLEDKAARRFNGNLDGAFYDLVGACEPVRDFLAGARPVTRPKLVGPLRQSASGLVSRRALLVGDAAGFIDGITGEGMSIALISARLAAAAIHAALIAGNFEARHLAPYENRQRRISRDLTRFTELVLWGIRYPGLASRVVRTLRRHPDTFSRLLGVNTGQGLMQSMKFKDVYRLVAGA